MNNTNNTNNMNNTNNVSVGTYKCPLSTNVIDIKYIENNAHIDNIIFDEQNIKCFVVLFKNIVESLLPKNIETFTQVVTDDDWENILCDISEWTVISEIKEMNLKIIQCDARDILHCIGQGLGLDCVVDE
jgi:hypothetical protein